MTKVQPGNNLLGQVPVRQRGTLRRLLAFVGPAYLVSVGYMDPGNWATDIEGGSRFGYTLIWVLLMSNLMAVMLQTLAARMGIVTGFDLAQGCRREYPRFIGIGLWVLAELAIAATDLAEALGTILGLNLLFGLPLLWGCFVTAFDTVLLLLLFRLGIRKMEAFIVMLVATIGTCFIIEIFLAQPEWGGIAAGFVPRLPEGALYVAIGIIGATVMPHNLYLHSALVQSRQISNTITGKAQACRFNFLDSVVALNAAFFVNAGILIMAAAVFHRHGHEVTEIQQAHELLKPILGSTLAPIIFAVALLAAGQSSTLTGTISGQVVMEGFLDIRVRPWLRRLITRSVALVPAVVVIALYGDRGTYKLLILSQVILSLQLPFAIIPLISFTSDRRKMGGFVNPFWLKVAAWIVAGVILALNIKLVSEEIGGWVQRSGWVWLAVIPPLLGVGGVLVYLVVTALRQRGRVWGKELVGESSAVAQRIKPRTVRHIGVALERTPGDAEVISAALALARAWQARLTLLHIVETPGTLVYGEQSGSRHATEDENYLESLVREVEERDLPVEMMLRHGRPAEEIVKAVREGGFDLLVLGSHGHGHLADWVFGQTVDKVRHGIEIPVYVVRSG